MGQGLSLAKAKKEYLKLGTVFLEGITVKEGFLLTNMLTQKTAQDAFVSYCCGNNYHKFNTTQIYYLKILEVRSLKKVSLE